MDTEVCTMRVRDEDVFTRANSTSDNVVNLLSVAYLVVFRVVYAVVRCARHVYNTRKTRVLSVGDAQLNEARAKCLTARA